MTQIRKACVECGSRATNIKYSGPCANCGAATCPRHSYFYSDESNTAITDHAQPMCLIHRDRDPGTLSADNLLISGDFEYRQTARARFVVQLTQDGSRVSATVPVSTQEGTK